MATRIEHLSGDDLLRIIKEYGRDVLLGTGVEAYLRRDLVHGEEVVLWHRDSEIVTGRVRLSEMKQELLRNAGDEWKTLRWLGAAVRERCELTTLQVLTFAQLTGPHVGGTHA